MLSVACLAVLQTVSGISINKNSFGFIVLFPPLHTQEAILLLLVGLFLLSLLVYGLRRSWQNTPRYDKNIGVISVMPPFFSFDREYKILNCVLNVCVLNAYVCLQVLLKAYLALKVLPHEVQM